MKEIVLSAAQVARLEDIYDRLQQEYQRVAQALDFSCTGCPDNCCDSYFQHHTYTEWAYLRLGLRRLELEQQQALTARARMYLDQCEQDLAAGRRPQIMCPLNENGRCLVYHNRLLVCRTHGVPATLTLPDGRTFPFPGCFRCQEIVESRNEKEVPEPVDRTSLLKKLALLEKELLETHHNLLPKIKITIAEMLVHGPPTIPIKKTSDRE